VNVRTRLFAALFLFSSAAFAAESGYTIKATDLKDKPYIDAVTIVTLPEKTQIEIVTRQGGWMHVRAPDKQQGWVRLLSVRLGNPDKRAKSGGNLLSAIGIGSRPRPTTTATVTTGVRGFSEEDLAKAAPNAAELEKMKGYAVTVADAQQAALQGDLEARQIGYFDADGKTMKEK